MGNNKELSLLLDSVENIANKAQSESELMSIFTKIREFLASGKKMKFDLGSYYVWAFGIAAFDALFAYVYFTDEQFSSYTGMYGIIGMVCGAVAVIAILVTASGYSDRVDSLSAKIFETDILFDNEMQDLNVPDNQYSKYREQFGDFLRGDEDREIEEMISGIQRNTKKQSAVPFTYYVFSYVVVTIIVVPVRVGNVTTMQTREVRTTYYRKGIIRDFPWVKSIVVKSSDGGSFDYPSTFRTGSEEFNKYYDVAASSTQNAANFLKPAIIVAFNEIARFIGGISIEINENGQMCFSFSEDTELLHCDRKHSLDDPDAFEKEILQKNYPIKLQKVMEFIDLLEEHSDSNF